VLASSGAWAEDGVTKSAILLGQSGEFSGQGVAKENIDGARAYFEAINKRGGVFGRRIELKAYDDGRDIKRVVENTERLIVQDKAFALFGYRSTPSVEAAMPVLTRERVPLIAPFSGAQSIRSPLNPLVFHLRASYRQEADKLIRHLVTQGIRKVALLYQDDAFGKDALAGYEAALKKANVASLATAKYDRKDLNVAAAVKTIAAAAPDAAVMACTPKACIDFIKQVRASGLRTQFLTLSNVNSDEFARSLGDDGRGVVVAQVIPYPWSTGVPLAREFQQSVKDSGMEVPISYSSFEGFVAAKLVVTALRLSGPEPTRDKFLAALETMRDVDLGGMSVRFSATDHQGSDFVDLTLISRGGKYIR
jgi:ABC-type branched-subunit amino acid transport system substrate-binding protein